MKAWNRPAALTSGRLEATGEAGEQLVAGRHVGEGLDVAVVSTRGAEDAALDDRGSGCVLAKSRSALAAVTASPPSWRTNAIATGPSSCSTQLREPGVGRGPAGEGVLEDLVVGRRGPQRGAQVGDLGDRQTRGTR